jgi:hypothetical protein
MDCADTGIGAVDACGCRPGFGWSVTTGRGCCKRGSATQPSEEASCRLSLGNTDCGDARAADACGCTAGFGWSVTTGRGCCKAGSTTAAAEVEVCRTALGNLRCERLGAAPATASGAAAER